MFGYVIADLGRLTEAQRLRYHSVYCGLCRALYADYGAAGALALTYDMTFLTLLLAALYEPEERSGAARCLRHPVRRRQTCRRRRPRACSPSLPERYPPAG